MDRYQKTVLNELLNKYERSRSYLGENRVSQNFAVIVAKKFPNMQMTPNMIFSRR